MLNPESKTLREFSLTTKTKNGDAIKVLFGYDTSANHSGYYMLASINDKKPSSDAKTMKRISGLKIATLDMIASHIGYDVTGAPYDMDEKAISLLTNDVCSVADLASFYHISMADTASCDALEAMVDRFDSTGAEKQRHALVSRFGNTQRIRMIEESRELVQNIREFYLKGIEINGQHVVPCHEGLLRMTHNPLYYKRDMDYIRKARVRLFRNVLKRSYKPF